MNNEQENREPELKRPNVVTPPPFRPQDELQAQEQTASPTLAERIDALGLDENATAALRQLTEGIDTETLTPDLLNTLARGITHDNDVENADAAGYLRGRNEKIEAVLHPEPEQPDESDTTPVFPHYNRRSIWDAL